MAQKNVDYFNYIKTGFEMSGYLPKSKSLQTYILKFILTPLLVVLIAFIIYDFRYMHQNIFEVAGVVESLSTHSHVLFRKLAILVHGPLLEELINDRHHFWKYDMFGKKSEKSFKQKMILRDFIIKCLTVVSVVMLAYFFFTPLVIKNIDLPQNCWIPGGTQFSKMIIYMLEVICLSECISVAIIIDGTFLLLCGEMEIQFSLLKKTLQSIRIGTNSTEQHEQKCFNNLKICSFYHSFLLKEHDKMQAVFSEFFLMQFLLTIQGLCIEIFVLHEADTWRRVSLAVIYIVGITMQSSFTFLSASNLEAEAETLVDDIYGVDWYNASNKQISRHIQFMLMRAQEPLRLTGAGLFDVNRNMFLQILRTGFSISTMIQQI